MVARIARVETEILASRHDPQLLVHVVTDDGERGTGETWWGTYRPDAEPGTPVRPIASAVENLLAPVCVGRDSEDIEGAWMRMARATSQYGLGGIVLTAMSGVDIALWDLLGKRRATPVAPLLGPIVRERLPVYASLTWLDTEAAVRRDTRRALDAGFRAIKLHEKDPVLALAARDEAGPDVAIMFDASSRLSVEEVPAVARVLAEAGVAWLEEPFWPPTDHRMLARVRAECPVPIAAGENEFTLDDFAHLLDAAAIDVLQPELAKLGGLTPAREVASLAAHHGIPIAPHNYSLGPSFLANLHWAAVVPGVTWVEVPFHPEGMSFPSGMEVPTVADGTIALPQGPGLGTIS